MTRDEKIAEARRLRGEGWNNAQIGERLGVTKSCVWGWLNPEKKREGARKQNARRASAKRTWEKENDRGTCGDCGESTSVGARRKGILRCRPCFIQHEVETSLTAQILQRYNAGETHHSIAAECGISIAHVGQMLHRVRHTDYGKPYIERYGFPTYRRTPAQIKRITEGCRRGLGLAA